MKFHKHLFFAAFSLLSGCSFLEPINNENQKSDIARKIFEDHCKTSGEKIYKNVSNVDGVYLLKLRREGINYSDQFALDDPYGLDLLGAKGYITSFLRGSFQANVTTAPTYSGPKRIGYFYVDAVDDADGKIHRYSSSINQPWLKDKSYLKGDLKFDVIDKILDVKPSRYGITFDDISTHQDREYWIAGSSLKVIDLENNEVLAERIGYMMDIQQGNTSGGRAPWLFAADHACPSFKSVSTRKIQPGFSLQSRQAQDFVEKVLYPTQNKK